MKSYFAVMKLLLDLLDVPIRSHIIKFSIWSKFHIILFQVSFPFLYHLKKIENPCFFWCFQGAQKGNIGLKQVNITLLSGFLAHVLCKKFNLVSGNWPSLPPDFDKYLTNEQSSCVENSKFGEIMPNKQLLPIRQYKIHIYYFRVTLV